MENVAGDVPGKRSGHTLTVVGEDAFMFGGLDPTLKDVPGGARGERRPGPNSDLYRVKLPAAGSTAPWRWVKVAPTGGNVPPPRYKHTATVVGESRLLIFGGFASSSTRYSDVWVLNTKKQTWHQPIPPAYTFDEQGNHTLTREAAKLGEPPAPRGGHSASLVAGKVWVFGGYGGDGFARRDFNDMHVFSASSRDIKWSHIPIKERTPAPHPRSSHSAVVVKNCIIVHGGWNAKQQFSDTWVFDTNTLIWSCIDPAHGAPRWGHSALAVEAIPTVKMIVFGGSLGDTGERARVQGSFTSRVDVFDNLGPSSELVVTRNPNQDSEGGEAGAATGDGGASTPAVSAGDGGVRDVAGNASWQPSVNVLGEAAPTPRSDTLAAYDARHSRMLVFGGWSNRWLDGLYSLDLSALVGPPYAVLDIEPGSGPVTGGQSLAIHGEGFLEDTDITVRFQRGKGSAFEEATARYVSPTRIVVDTPAFERLGPGKTQLRVRQGAMELTNTFQEYTFHSVTDASHSLAFGSGVLDGGAAETPAYVVVQARDSENKPRSTGEDNFTVSVKWIPTNAFPGQFADEIRGGGMAAAGQAVEESKEAPRPEPSWVPRPAVHMPLDADAPLNGTLTVHVHRGKGLQLSAAAAAGEDGEADPYVAVGVGKRPSGALLQYTHKVDDTADPEYDDVLTYVLKDHPVDDAVLRLIVADKDDGPDRDDFMGTATIDLLEDIMKAGGCFQHRWVPLAAGGGAEAGQLELSASFIPTVEAPEAGSGDGTFNPLAPLEGELAVKLISGKNLTPDSTAGIESKSADPYVVVRVGDKELHPKAVDRSATVQDALDPKFDQVLRIPLDGINPAAALMRVVVMDDDSDQWLGREDDFLGGATVADLVHRLAAGGGISQTMIVDLLDKDAKPAGSVTLQVELLPPAPPAGAAQESKDAHELTVRTSTLGTDDGPIEIDEDDEDLWEDVTSTTLDNGDGTYLIQYTPVKAGKYRVAITFNGTFGGNEGPVRGSPYIAHFYPKEEAIERVHTTMEEAMGQPPRGLDGLTQEEAAVRLNSLTGPLVAASIKSDLRGMSTFIKTSLSGLQEDVPEDSVPALMRVKEHLLAVADKQEGVELTSQKVKAALDYRARMHSEAEGGPPGGQRRMASGGDPILGRSVETSLTRCDESWEEVQRQVPITRGAIQHLIKVHGASTRGELGAYEARVLRYAEGTHKLPHWQWETGVGPARASLATAATRHEAEWADAHERKHVADMFDIPKTVKASLEAMEGVDADLENMRELWDLAEECLAYIAESKTTLWSEVDADLLEEEAKALLRRVNQGLHSSIKWCSAFKGLNTMMREFVSSCPLILALRHPSMRLRHWHALRDVTGKDFTPPPEDPSLRLDDLFNLQLHKFQAEVEEITDQAVKEAQMETVLARLTATWEKVKWVNEDLGDGVTTVKLHEDDVEVLENDQMAVQAMVGSRYRASFEEEITGWQTKLTAVADVVGLLGDVGRIWKYLAPLFLHSAEVKTALPDAATQFGAIDTVVRQVFAQAVKDEWVVAACNRDGVQSTLEEQQSGLEVCRKALMSFLDEKRRIFPRFFFVSEADLLHLLSNGDNPSAIMRHVSKVMLATKDLVLADGQGGGRPSATEFVAGVGKETVSFRTPVPLTGKAEAYLAAVLEGQQKSLQGYLVDAYKAYEGDTGRSPWLMKEGADGRPAFPAQIVVVVAAMRHYEATQAALGAVSTGSPDALAKYNEQQSKDLADLIRITRTSLTKEQRRRVMVMITQDSHQRDIVQQLVDQGVKDANAFQWQSQLKHTFVDVNGGDSHIKTLNTTFNYGYEYLGNAARLVITPLTDRIYVTATQALYLKMGCAPAGPAGTGKTETTKDLASAMGKACYVFNCSPEMDFRSLGNIFLGLAASGSWGCFDEFNRLLPEVLSVCSVQFKALCDAVREDKATVSIEGSEVKIDRQAGTAGVFITMNPGYLGRAELPEGLKALFRPITVMVPDLVLITENFLMAEGFEASKLLARKFYGLYSLLQELLSKQSHYDWGLRAVKSVLVVAGAFKRAEPELDEQELLMRALRDFNTPKIVQADRVVFFGLLSDLFPAIDPPRKRSQELESAVVAAAEKRGLAASDDFCLKCVQLDELLEIRHSVFLLGPPGCGKTETWKTLQAARSTIGRKTLTRDLNPKAVSPAELYGHVVLATRDWKDGLLPEIMRSMGEIPDEDPKWIMLDGDLDANWIESMNSVMDDNKMLTLASNERIPLKDHMRMLFELRDLRFASPATVSRAGIIFISSDTGYQWRNLVASWLAAAPYPPSICATLQVLFDEYLPPILLYHKKTLQPLVPLEDTALVGVFLDYLSSLLPVPGDADRKRSQDEAAAAAAAAGRRSPRAKKKAEKQGSKSDMDSSAYYATHMKVADLVDEAQASESSEPLDPAVAAPLEYVFAYSAVWAFGSCAGEKDGVDWKREFSDWFKASFKGVRFPSRDSVFDFTLNPDTGLLESWKASPLFYPVTFDSSKMDMATCYVPTPETVAISFWARRLMDAGKPVMMAGAAGCGKTALLKGLMSQMDSSKYIANTINFNFYVDALALQGTLESSLDRKSGTTYGPPGTKSQVVFLDDLNLPEVDPYDTQSAIALVRQHIDYGHWYDRAKLFLKSIINTQYVAAMNPTTGSFHINPRLQRHFATFAVDFPGALSLLTIYQTFLDGHLASFPDEVQAISSHLINGALGLHAAVSGAFKKSARNIHYEFSVRHLSAVFQGLLTAQPAQFKDPGKLVRLWLHESDRVYSDRLVTEADAGRYKQLALAQAKKRFPQYNLSAYFAQTGAEPLLFCHFAETRHDGVYDKVSSMDTLTRTIGDALKEHNEVSTAMNLVLFGDAVRHVTRISRVLRSPTAGHALLMGVGGSGKQSLARLAAFLCDLSISSIRVSATYSMTDFKEDVKALYYKTGVKQEGVMFLLRDSQITNERFLVILNDILASGSVAGLYAAEDKDTIVGDIAGKVKAAGLSTDKDTCWEYFMSQVRANLHVVLCFSPGDVFARRALRFPALINSTTIDWFHPWPEEALLSVGRRTLAEVSDLGTPKVREAIVQFMPFAFQAVNEVATRFAESDRRRAYTTPKSFLEGLKLYTSLLAAQRTQLLGQIDRLGSGVDKLEETAEDVARIEASLKELLDAAEEKRAAAEVIADAVSAKAAQVEAETNAAQKEQSACEAMKVQVQAQQQETEQDLRAAEPLLENAEKALNTLDPKDLGLCRGMMVPPPGVDDVFAAVAVLFAGVDPNVPVTKRGIVKEENRKWDPVKRALLKETAGFLQNLLDFRNRIDAGDVPARNFAEVRPYLELDYFNSDAMLSKNPAAAGLTDFVRNIVEYYDVLCVVAPKREALAEATEKLAAATTRLQEVQEKVDELQAALSKLQEEQAAANAERAKAQAEVDGGTRRLDLAQRLLRALGDEKERWSSGIQSLNEQRTTLVGDVLLASAFVSFAGPFTSRYRDELLNDYWVPFLQEPPSGTPVPLTEDLDPLTTLANTATIAKWHAHGLPSDTVSTQNGAITQNTSRWPLLLDPQLQGIKWVRRMEGSALLVARMDNKDLVHRMATAIQEGRPMLLENLPEHIDATLWPVITRATVKRGRRRVLVLGDRELDWNKDFRLYLHTKLSNPHYPPEVQAETTLINFTVTPEGLEEQLLDITVQRERRDLATERSALIRQQNKFTVKIKELEDGILQQLAEAEGEVTENVELIESLENAKRLSHTIGEKMRTAKVTQQQIAETAEQYRPVAARAALLFFLMDSLANMHTYYVHSLSSFISVFLRGIDAVTDLEVDEEATAAAAQKRAARDARLAAAKEAAEKAMADSEAAFEAEAAARAEAEREEAARAEAEAKAQAAREAAAAKAAELQANSDAVAKGVAAEVSAPGVALLKSLLVGAGLRGLLKHSPHRTVPGVGGVPSSMTLSCAALRSALDVAKASTGALAEVVAEDESAVAAGVAEALQGQDGLVQPSLLLGETFLPALLPAGTKPTALPAVPAAASGSPTYVQLPSMASEWTAKVWVTLPPASDAELPPGMEGGDAKDFADFDAAEPGAKVLQATASNSFALSVLALPAEQSGESAGAAAADSEKPGDDTAGDDTAGEEKDDKDGKSAEDGEGKDSEGKDAAAPAAKLVPVKLLRSTLAYPAAAKHEVVDEDGAWKAVENARDETTGQPGQLIEVVLRNDPATKSVHITTADGPKVPMQYSHAAVAGESAALVLSGTAALLHGVFVSPSEAEMAAASRIQGAWADKQKAALKAAAAAATDAGAHAPAASGAGDSSPGASAASAKASAVEEEEEEEDIPEGTVYKVKVLESEELPARAQELKGSVTSTMFSYVRMGLFETDKLTVATLLALKVLVQEGKLDPAAARLLVRADSAPDASSVGVLSDWMSQATWGKVKALESLSETYTRFETLGEDMQLDSDKWQTWMEDEQPEAAKLPGRHRSATAFERLLLLRAMRPDRLPLALRSWISEELGDVYVKQPNFSMQQVYNISGPTVPVFFVLFPGVDPTTWVEALGAENGITEENGLFVNISMGQGQDSRAEAQLHRLAKEGGWLMLQNVHLMQDWLPRLERQLELASEGAHANFRCFLSAEPPPFTYIKNMPESIMQGAIKVSNEAPSDLQSNLLRAWGNFSDDKVADMTKGDSSVAGTFKSTLFTLCFFHAIMLGRRRFGQQGWSKSYSFNTGDLTICADILADYLVSYQGAVPWDDLRYLFGAIMYGGHITDFWDRRTNRTYLEVLFQPSVLKEGDLVPELATLQVADTFTDPTATDTVVPGFAVPGPSLSHQEVEDHIASQLPPEQPKVYGLHPNSELNYLISSTDTLFTTIVQLEGAELFPSPKPAGGKKKRKRRAKKASGGGGADVGVAGAAVVRGVIADIMGRLPEQFSMIDLQMRAEPLLLEGHGPYVVVALQECGRMNVLLAEIRRTLDELSKGLDGQLNITAAMEDLASALAINQVPGRNPFHSTSWEKLAWWSRRSLSSWFNDLLVRVAQLEEWSSGMALPSSVWLPGLFNPTAFLTAVQQVVARRNSFPLDSVTIDTHMTTMMDASAVEDYPADGAFVHGLFIEGARFASKDEDGALLDPYVEGGAECAGYLAESHLKELLPPVPVMYVKAVEINPAWEPTSVGYLRHEEGLYECPLYYTTMRGPTYVTLATLRSRDPTTRWVLAGVALIMQEDE